MITFNSENIFVGYIKQSLHSFNLPTARIYSDKYLYKGGLYIKDNNICAYDGTKFKNLHPYVYNTFIPNYSKSLRLDKTEYDSYTHEYLGEYLRFIRDYHHVNLMSMYNCFSNNLCSNMSVKFNLPDNTSVVFDSDNDLYKIYAIPIKCFEQYSIAIESENPVEVFCGFYAKEFFIKEIKVGDASDDNYQSIGLEEKTYKKYASMKFNQVEVFNLMKNFTETTTDEIKKILFDYENNLKLFIKLPASNNSSIVVLEGNYAGRTNNVLDDDITYEDTTRNNTNVFRQISSYKVINMENESDLSPDLNLDCNLQLLKMNTHTSYPFSDRLTEYLVGNPVSNLDNIDDNIKRIQYLLKSKYPDKFIRTDGLWRDEYKYYLYALGVTNNWFDDVYDNLGYFDKTLEKKLGKDPDIYTEDKITSTNELKGGK